MQPSSLKKVVLQCRSQSGGLEGFLALSELEAGPLHLLTLAGQDLEIAPADLLAIYFVNEFPGYGLPSLGGPRAGARLPGLWVRVRGKGVRWDGVLASDLLELERGIWLTPLRAGSSCQRAFIPRRVVDKLEAVEVARPVRRRQPRARTPVPSAPPQFELFHEMNEETP